MQILSIIYLIYMFFSLYFLFFYLIIYFTNKKTLFDYPKITKNYSVSFVIPAYNESKTIEDTIKHIFRINYKNIKEVIVVNDNSTDNTKEIVEGLKKKFPKLILINNKKNSGNAAGPKNIGLKKATGELIAFVDADSYPKEDCLEKMIGFFDDKKVGAVTCSILVRNQKNLLGKMQEIEYKTIALTRKLLDYLEAVYVTPGPLAIYRKTAIEEIGGFNEKNLTEDIEIVWNLTKHGWERKMSLATEVTTTVPEDVKSWYKQRLRWSLGGAQCIIDYKKEIFKKGILGMFIVPFFIFQFALGIVGVGVFTYIAITNIIFQYRFINYSVPAKSAILTMNDFFVTPSFLNYLGIILFVVGFIFTLFTLSQIERIKLKESVKKHKLKILLCYSLFYLMLYPIISIHAIYKYFKRESKW